MTKEFLERVIFLDFDGVLLTRQSGIYWGNLRIRRPDLYEHSPYEHFCPIAISNLSFILQHIPAVKIVFSTSWRNYSLEKNQTEILGNILVQAGLVLPGDASNTFHSCTPLSEVFSARQKEIGSWFQHYKCGRYVILDDIPNLGVRHVFVDDEVGLDFRAVRKVFKLFEVDLPII